MITQEERIALKERVRKLHLNADKHAMPYYSPEHFGFMGADTTVVLDKATYSDGYATHYDVDEDGKRMQEGDFIVLHEGYGHMGIYLVIDRTKMSIKKDIEPEYELEYSHLGLLRLPMYKTKGGYTGWFIA